MPKWLKRNDKRYYIYALIDPRDRTTRYIGISNDARLRYDQHIHGGSNKYVWRWIQELGQLGMSPDLQILETIDRETSTSFIDFIDIVHDREAYWIEAYMHSGASLLNRRGVATQHPKITIRRRDLDKENIMTNMQSANRTHLPAAVVNTNNYPPMRLEDFRIEVAVLTRQELATIADVSISSIQRAEEGKGVNRLTQARILKGLSKYLGRTVSREEIDEFR